MNSETRKPVDFNAGFRDALAANADMVASDLVTRGTIARLFFLCGYRRATQDAIRILRQPIETEDDDFS